jgi:hypothetical protein
MAFIISDLLVPPDPAILSNFCGNSRLKIFR